jgi:hypothetical protein
VLSFAMPFASLRQLFKASKAKNAEPNLHVLSFSSSNFNMQGHIMSTVGDTFEATFNTLSRKKERT